MVTPDQILWAKYEEFEGPFFRGTKRYAIPVNPTEEQKLMAVLASTEGPLDAVNMYDSCILSLSLTQLCERFYLCSALLGHVIEKCGEDSALVPLDAALKASQATFKKNSAGLWRFSFLDERGEVNSVEKQHELFLKCDGKQGSWTPEARQHAKLWAACCANVFQDAAACAAQVDFVSSKLPTFVTTPARKALFDDHTGDSDAGNMLRAAYVSFAANNPSHASDQLQVAMNHLKSPKWSEPWCIGVIKQLTFGPNIAIYPTRYNAITHVLQSLWSVKLPDTAAALATWHEDDVNNEEQHSITVTSPITPDIVKDVAPDQSPSIKLSFIQQLISFILNIFTRSSK